MYPWCAFRRDGIEGAALARFLLEYVGGAEDSSLLYDGNFTPGGELSPPSLN